MDSPVTFELASKTADKKDAQSDPANDKAKSAQSAPAEEQSEADDPSFRIGNVKSATAGLVSVTPNASLQEAVTLMMTRNYSQLPVMTGLRDLRGVISWKSIGARLSANISSGEVRVFMDAAKELPIDASLFAGIPIIADHGYVLIRAENREFTGIVTASDIAYQFEDISKPFLLLAEIENQLRTLISRKLNKADIKKANADEFLPPDFAGVHALTFANCVAALSHPENWTSSTLVWTERCSALNSPRSTRSGIRSCTSTLTRRTRMPCVACTTSPTSWAPSDRSGRSKARADATEVAVISLRVVERNGSTAPAAEIDLVPTYGPLTGLTD